MKVVGLITEYNPFHNGHLYHIKEAKRITNADTVVVVMSGNFVQRGTCAILDKYSRTQIALEAGADVVIELPICYATASAEYFAMGGISILHNLKYVDAIIFGSECGDLKLLESIAEIYENEPIELANQIQQYVKLGMAYPAARAKALIDYLSLQKQSSVFEPSYLETVIQSPNNILGIEYLRAIKRLKSSIQPFTISRVQSQFHDEELTGKISSATAIRKSIELEKLNSIKHIKEAVPSVSYKVLKQKYGKSFPIGIDDVSVLLNFKLLSEDENSLLDYLDVSPDIANRICNLRSLSSTFTEFVDFIRTKQYTQTRIQRCLIHILLGIKENDLKRYSTIGYTPYARILGFRTSASSFLKRCSTLESITLITKLAKANLSEDAMYMLNQDIYATHLYNLLIAHRFGIEPKNEYTYGLVLVKD